MLHQQIQQKMKSFFQYQNLNQKFKKELSFSIFEKQLNRKQQFYPWEHSNGIKQRRIFYSVNFNSQQLLAIYRLKMMFVQSKLKNKNESLKSFKSQESQKNQIQLQDEILLKHIHATGFNIQQSFQRVNLHKIIIKNFLSQKKHGYSIIGQQLQKGMIYTYGYTKQGFPIVILRLDLVDTSKQVQKNFQIFNYLLSTVLHFKMKKPHCEKFIFLMDLNGLSFSQIDYKYLYKFMMKIGILYCGMNDKIFVFNSHKIGVLWSLVKKILPEHIVRKVQFIQNQNYDPIFQIIDKNHLQQKYGGNLQNLKIFWPPQSVQQAQFKNKIQINQTQQINLNFRDEQDQTQYYSFQNNSSMYNSILPAKTNRTYKSLGIATKKFIEIDQSKFQLQKQFFQQKEEPVQNNGGMCGQHCSCKIY